MELDTIVCGDCLDVMANMPDGCVQCVVTSPPYWGLRDYGVEGQMGLEPTPELYVAHLVEIFSEVKRVLRDDGTVWLNMGDSYASRLGGHGGFGDWTTGGSPKPLEGTVSSMKRSRCDVGLKPKDLCGIPWRVAFALQRDGWWLRSDIIWHKPNCMPESVKDRPTKAHEYVFLLSKSKRYYYDQDAVREGRSDERAFDLVQGSATQGGVPRVPVEPREANPAGRNRRTVWTIPTQPYSGAHFAVFPEKLVEPCIKAGTSERGACPECGAGWVRIVEKGEPVRIREGSDTDAARALEMAKGRHGDNSIFKTGGKCPVTTIGWQPTCTCGLPDGFKPNDFELILTPTGERVGDDPSLVTGRAGYNRPRGSNEGTRPITRYEQRQYAKQLKDSPQRGQMEVEAGSAFAHYIRTDNSGARPIPPDLLNTWVRRGWLEQVYVPEWDLPEPVPSLVFDPFMGAGTTALVALKLGRRFYGAEINPEYVKLVNERLETAQLSFSV